jgi:hypothetical protein
LIRVKKHVLRDGLDGLVDGRREGMLVSNLLDGSAWPRQVTVVTADGPGSAITILIVIAVVVVATASHILCNKPIITIAKIEGPSSRNQVPGKAITAPGAIANTVALSVALSLSLSFSLSVSITVEITDAGWGREAVAASASGHEARIAVSVSAWKSITGSISPGITDIPHVSAHVAGIEVVAHVTSIRITTVDQVPIAESNASVTDVPRVSCIAIKAVNGPSITIPVGCRRVSVDITLADAFTITSSRHTRQRVQEPVRITNVGNFQAGLVGHQLPQPGTLVELLTFLIIMKKRGSEPQIRFGEREPKEKKNSNEP